MTKKPQTSKDAADKVVKNIRRKTRQAYSAEEKIRIVLAGLRGEESISVLCRRESIAESLYYSWSKEFLEAGKRRFDLWAAELLTRHITDVGGLTGDVTFNIVELADPVECLAGDLGLGRRPKVVEVSAQVSPTGRFAQTPRAIGVNRHAILTPYRRPKMTPLFCAGVAGPMRCSHHTAQPRRASGVWVTPWS